MSFFLNAFQYAYHLKHGLQKKPRANMTTTHIYSHGNKHRSTPVKILATRRLNLTLLTTYYHNVCSLWARRLCASYLRHPYPSFTSCICVFTAQWSSMFASISIWKSTFAIYNPRPGLPPRKAFAKIAGSHTRFIWFPHWKQTAAQFQMPAI